ncbi:acyltransferase domain-containing protein [Nocardiopsis eucommiae]|uniref:Acyltransferase domain-containing protein n=1 Tax=Nocardiopsis eucommiae TaxID=2831970 RepID=A0A975LCN8_9ACTN|nr:acyltransferase domain-containing protein [Nocardiopsis eucommiae]
MHGRRYRRGGGRLRRGPGGGGDLRPSASDRLRVPFLRHRPCRGGGAVRTGRDHASAGYRALPLHRRPRAAVAGGGRAPASPLDGTSLDADYWYRNLRHGVLLEPVVRRLAEASGAFVEVGPHPVLSVPMRETLESVGAGDRPLVHTLQRDQDPGDRFLAALAEAHCQGWRSTGGAFWAGAAATSTCPPTPSSVAGTG